MAPVKQIKNENFLRENISTARFAERNSVLHAEDAA